MTQPGFVCERSRKISAAHGHFGGEIDALLPLNDDTEVVDAGFRGSSQERLMPRAGTFAQAYTGPMGRKQVVWQRGDRMPDELGEVVVWFNGVRSTDAAAQSAAALVADGYGLFLLGPLYWSTAG